MKKFNSQAETHSRPGRALRGSRTTHAETHSRPAGPPRALSPKRQVCCNFATAYFFLFLYRLQAQAHSGPSSSPRASRTMSKNFLFLNRLQAQAHSNRVGQPLSSRALCRNLFFFLFIFRLQAQARAVAQQQRTWMATRFFIDSPYYIGY